MVPTQSRQLSPSEIVERLFPEPEASDSLSLSSTQGLVAPLEPLNNLSGVELGEKRFQRLLARTAMARTLS